MNNTLATHKEKQPVSDTRVTLRQDLPAAQARLYGVMGLVGLMVLWFIITTFRWVSPGTLPPIPRVIKGFFQLFTEEDLLHHMGVSIFLNASGYLEAILVSLPLGFLIGLNKRVRAVMMQWFTALRFLPLAPVLCLFIAWFHMGYNMKIQFLAFGIIVYLVPQIVARIQELDPIYEDTIITTGGKNWHAIRYVYMPATLAQVLPDIRVLVAISWTYITLAEALNENQGGLGALTNAVRYSDNGMGKVYAILGIIMFIGFMQDFLFAILDRALFPYKRLMAKKQGGK